MQTPLTGPGARLLQIGDWVWFRHAKSGELAEHTNLVHLLAGDAIVDDGAVLPRPRAGLVSPAASAGPTADDWPPSCRWRTSRAPTLGGGRLICLDGPAGSGKTTWAAGIAQLAAGGHAWCTWTTSTPAGPACREVDAQLDGLLRPLAEDGRAPTAATTGWPASSPSGSWSIPVPLLVARGRRHAGRPASPTLVTVLVWVEAPEHVRMERGIARDGDAFAPHWEQWAVDEARGVRP